MNGCINGQSLVEEKVPSEQLFISGHLVSLKRGNGGEMAWQEDIGTSIWKR